MKKTLILFLIIISGGGLFGQIGDEAESRGDSAFRNGNIELAISEYKKVFLVNPNEPFAAYNVAAAYAMNWQYDSAFKYLDLHLLVDTTIEACTDPSFLHLRKNERWAQFQKKAEGEVLMKRPNAISDLPLAEILWSMMALDQQYYYEIHIVEQKLGATSTVELAFWDIKQSINDRNANELDSIVNVKGWPKISQVGHLASTAAFLIVQHSTLERQKKYLPTIKTLCEQNEANWEDYALMYDRVQVSENKPQLYGSQIKYNAQTGLNEFYPIDDEKNVNQRRAAMNLEPLEVYASEFGIKYIPKK